jgi:glycosyltransferase involved in cell wall biosynthesis
MNRATKGAVGGVIEQRRCRVIYLLPTLRTGGAEKHVVSLASHLDRSRFDPHVICLTSGGNLEAVLDGNQIPYYILGNRHGRHQDSSSPFRHVGGIRRLVRLVRTLRPDIVHAYLPVPNVYCAAAKTLSGHDLQLIVSKRALSDYKNGRPLLALAERWANRVADRILVNSRAVADDIVRREKAPRGKIRLVYNGVDVGRFARSSEGGGFRDRCGIPTGVPLIASIANLRSVKGLKDLVDTAARVLESYPEARFTVIGRDDGEGESLRKQVEALGIAHAVTFPGARDDIPRVLKEVDILVQPSLSEGFSNVVLEGMAAGRAIVATNVGGNPEAIQDEVNGLLVEPRSPGKLAEAILKLLQSPDLAQRLGKAAQERVRSHFSMETMVSSMERLYDEVLASRSRHGGRGSRIDDATSQR